LKVKNLLLVALCTCLYIGIQTLIILTMHFAHLAGVNVGIITTIWGIQPLLAAVLDFFINGQRLTKFHLAGIIFIVLGGICVSVSGNSQSSSVLVDNDRFRFVIQREVKPLVPKFVAVIFGALTPCFFVAGGLFTKHATQASIGFNPQ
jgi:drug/metabolite transporter (DMT)-like permease